MASAGKTFLATALVFGSIQSAVRYQPSERCPCVFVSCKERSCRSNRGTVAIVVFLMEIYHGFREEVLIKLTIR